MSGSPAHASPRRTRKGWVLCVRRAILSATACLATASHARPIESYVSPPDLFPPEGAYGAQLPPSLPAYDATRRHIAAKVSVRQACDSAKVCGKVVELETPNGNTHRLETAEWSYETGGMVSYRPPEPAGPGFLWSALDTPLGLFWIRTAAGHVHRYEGLVTVVESPAQWCETTSKCYAMNYSFAQEQRRVAALVTCYGSPYQVVGTVTARTRRFYRLALPDPLPPDVQTWLPRSGLVPVRDKDGEHTGTFYSRGC